MIVLYSTNCPLCNVLEKKLIHAEVDFAVEHDVSEIIELGFMSAPVLRIDEDYLNFQESLEWLKTRRNDSNAN